MNMRLSDTGELHLKPPDNESPDANLACEEAFLHRNLKSMEKTTQLFPRIRVKVKNDDEKTPGEK